MDCSIIIPTYNRKKFSDLISHNIITQDYPLIKEIIIADDGDDAERLVLNVPYTVLYYKVPRCSIGEKRNFLISKCSGYYVACFDTDDFYHPRHLSTSIFNLMKNNKNVSGSSDMLLLSDGCTYKQRCIYLNLLNEATLVFTREYGVAHRFSNTSSSEGAEFLPTLGDIYENEIEKIMVCVAHTSNTVSKAPWTAEKYATDFNMDIYSDHIKLLSLAIT